MKRFKTRQIALCVAAAIASAAFAPVSFAASFSDTAGHWAEEAINVWSDRGVIQGFDGMFNPNDYVTRAEAASILSGAVGYIDEAGDDFADVAEDAWYAPAVKKASAAKAINGDGTGLFRPNDQITREEAAVIFANAFGIPQNADVSAFSDAEEIADWAKGYVGGMTEAGYLSGDDGAYRPKRALTRAEMVTILNNMVKTYIDQAGTYTQNNTNGGIILVKAGGVTLNTVSADGIVISPAVGSGSVTIQNAVMKRELKNLAPDAKVQTVGTSVSLPGMNTGSGGISTGGSGGSGGGTTGAQKSSKITVDAVADDEELMGMLPAEFMENISVSGNTDVRIRGTLKYVTGLTAYNEEEPAEQNGYFLALRIKPSNSTSKMNLRILDKNYGKSDLVDGAITIFRRVDAQLFSKGFTIEYDADGSDKSYKETTYSVNLGALVREPSAQLVPVDDDTKLLGDEKASDLMDGVRIEKKSGSGLFSTFEFNASGTLKYYKNYTEFSDSKNEQEGNYLVVRLIPKVLTDDIVVTIQGVRDKNDPNKNKKTFTKDDFEEDGSLITIWHITDKLIDNGDKLQYEVDYDGSGDAFLPEGYIIDVQDLEREVVLPLSFAAAPTETAAFDQGFTQKDFVRSFRLTTPTAEDQDLKATGALRYVENTGFAPGTEQDSGHFVILEITPDDKLWSTRGEIEVNYGDYSKVYGNGDLDGNGKLNVPVRADDAKNGGLIVFLRPNGVDTVSSDIVRFAIDFSGVTLLEKPDITVSAAPMDKEAWNGKTQADFVEDGFEITDVNVEDGFDFRAAGTLKYAEETGYWPDDDRNNGHFVILEITPAAEWDTENGTITREYLGVDEDWASRTYQNDSLEDGKLYLCVRVDDINQEQGLLITVDLDGEGTVYEAKDYIIDFYDILEALKNESQEPEPEPEPEPGEGGETTEPETNPDETAGEEESSTPDPDVDADADGGSALTEDTTVKEAEQPTKTGTSGGSGGSGGSRSWNETLLEEIAAE